MLNIVALQGRLTADPELKTTPSGVSVTSFRVAVERNYAPKGQERQTDFITIVAWQGTSEFICKHFSKGDMIAVSGKIETRNYEDRNGNKRTAVEVVANEVSFCGRKEGGNQESRAASRPAFKEPDVEPDPKDFEEIMNDDLPF